MAYFDLYGTSSTELDAVKNELETILGVSFEARESDYHGGLYYRCGSAGGEHFVLKRNLDSFDGEAVEQSFSGYPILLYINDTPHNAELSDGVLRLLNNFVLLRHEYFE